MERDFRLKDYLGCVSRMPVLSELELAKAFDAWAKGDERARRLLEERYLIRVVGWAGAYRGAGLGFMGLIETGNRGLLKALRRTPPANAADLTEHLRLAVEVEIEAALLARRGA